MKFSCKKCRAQYTIADEKIRGKVIKVRCKRCQQLIIVREEERPPEVAAPSSDGEDMLQDTSLELEFESAFRDLYQSGLEKSAPAPKPRAAPPPPPEPAPGASEPVWFYGLDGSEEGPFTLAEMEEHLRRGRLTPDHFAWRDGMEDWKPLTEVPELAELLPRPDNAARAEARRRAVEAEREEAFRARLQARRKTMPPAPEPPPVEILKEKKLKEEAQRQDLERKQAEEKKKEEERRRKEEREREERRREEERRRREEEDERKRAEAKKEEQRRREAERRAEEARRRENEERERRRKKDESRIAEHFFSRGDSLAEAEAPLPPPPVMDAEEAARELQQASLAEEESSLAGAPPQGPGTSPMPGEISEVIVRQAGVASGGRRLGVALLLIFGILGLAGGMLALAFSQGWFSPPAGSHTLSSNEKQASAEDVGPLSEEEARRLRAQIWDVKRPARPQAATSTTSGGRATAPGTASSQSSQVLSEREKELLAFYQEQDQSRSEASPRLPSAGLLGATALAPDLPGTAPVSVETGKIPDKGPEARPEAPAPAADSRRLSEEQIRSVIQLHYRQVKNCLERQLKRDSSLTGRLEVVARVQPDGSVQSAAVTTPRFRGSVLESCLVKTVRRWRFPAFAGEAYELTFPLLLSAQQEY